MPMDRLDQILQRISLTRQAGTGTLPNEPSYKCNICKDKELIDRGDGVYVYCECRKQKVIDRLIKSSMIDPNFSDSTFDNYIPISKKTAEMLKNAKEYAEYFPSIRHEKHNGFALTARVGESKLNSIPDPRKRAEFKIKHNSYGLGKTHLQTAIAIHLLSKGVQVLMVNDTDIMSEIRQGQFAEDKDYFDRIITRLENVELLIWDDLGKAKATEWVQNQYYRIFNYRYRNRLPICFSSNEDMDSLAEKIGDATVSRLSGMCKGRVIECEGNDYRLQ